MIEKGKRNHKLRPRDKEKLERINGKAPKLTSTQNQVLKKSRNKKRRQYNNDDIPSI